MEVSGVHLLGPNGEMEKSLVCIMYSSVVTFDVLASMILSSVIALIRARTILLIDAVGEISI